MRIWLVCKGSKRDGDERLLMCTFFKIKLIRFVISKIKDGTFEYKSCRAGESCSRYGNDTTGKENQIAAFMRDAVDGNFALVNLLLDGGYIGFATDGKEIL